MSLVESLTVSYCNEWLRGSFVVYEGEVYTIDSFRYLDEGESNVPGDVVLRSVESRGAVRINHEWLTGFSVLAYPELGYRKVEGCAYHYSRRQTAYRGLRPQVLVVDPTPATSLAEVARRQHGNGAGSPGNAAGWKEVMLPTYDTPDVLDEVFAGRALCYVPNNLICIEPLPRAPMLGVYYKEKLVGTISHDRVLDIAAPNIRKAVEAVI